MTNIWPINPCLDLIKELHKNDIKLALVTSDTTNNANLVCEKLNLSKYFDYILGGDLNLKKKESGEPAIRSVKR